MSLLGGPRVPQAFMLATPTGLRYCLYHAAAENRAPKSPVLYLHPFAEELNTTRRVVSQQARALASAGHPVLQIDLYGCGDSEGEFADATWEIWQEDVRHAFDWLVQRSGRAPWLWGCRCGALLSCSLPELLQKVPGLLWWQPVHSGAAQLQQFLRLDLAQRWMQPNRTTQPSASQRMNAGEAVDIAGYTLSPRLARGLNTAQLNTAQRRANGRLVWIDVSNLPQPVPSNHAKALRCAWEGAGWQVEHRTLDAPLFWQTIGFEDAPQLLQATLELLKAADTGHGEGH